MSLLVLYESAVGYSLFTTEESAGIAIDSPSIQVDLSAGLGDQPNHLFDDY